MTLKTFNALHKTSCDKGECFQLALSTPDQISFLPDVTTQVSNFNRLCSKTSEEEQNKKKIREVATGRAAAEAINDKDAAVAL